MSEGCQSKRDLASLAGKVIISARQSSSSCAPSPTLMCQCLDCRSDLDVRTQQAVTTWFAYTNAIDILPPCIDDNALRFLLKSLPLVSQNDHDVDWKIEVNPPWKDVATHFLMSTMSRTEALKAALALYFYMAYDRQRYCKAEEPCTMANSCIVARGPGQNSFVEFAEMVQSLSMGFDYDGGLQPRKIIDIQTVVRNAAEWRLNSLQRQALKTKAATAHLVGTHAREDTW